MSIVMSRLHSFADSDGLGSPYAAYPSAFPLFADEHESSAAPLPMPLSSPIQHHAAPQPRRPSSNLLRLSPTFTPELQYYQWNDPSAAAPLASGNFARPLPFALPLPASMKDELSGYGVPSFQHFSNTPSISHTSAGSSSTSYSSPPSTPPSTASPTPTPSPNPHHSLSVSRQCSATLGSSGDRVLRKRRRQRECDIQRRQKENMGFNRLYVLLTSSNTKKQQKLLVQQEQQQQLADEEDEDDSERKMNKADILHQSAERIEQLERMLTELTEAHSRRKSLEWSTFTHSAACVVVIHVPTGYVTDASERYLQHTGFERSWVVGRRFLSARHLIQSDPMCLTRPRPCSPQHDDRVLCKPRSTGVLQATMPKAQSEKTIRLLLQLYDGEIDTMCAVWRSQFGDGSVMEKTVHSWITEWEEHDDGTRSPLYVIGLVSTSETVCVE